jgi:hypothetical protein
MASVLSVNHYTLTLGDSATSDSVDISSDVTTIANCIPFISVRATVEADGRDNFNEYMVDAYFSGNNLVAETNAAIAGGRQLVVEAYVVEFDGTSVTVDSGTFTKANGNASDTATITATNTAKSFHYHTYTCDQSVNDYEQALCGCKFTTSGSSVTSLTFEVSNTTSTMTGHWYVAEAQGTEFAVTHVTTFIPGDETDIVDTTSISGITAASTIVLGNVWYGNNDDPRASTLQFTLDSGSQFTLQRVHSDAQPLYWNGQFIEWSDATTVTRYSTTADPGNAGGTRTINVDITSAGLSDLTAAMPMLDGLTGQQCGGSFNENTSQDVQSAFVAVDLTTTTNLRAQYLSASDTNSDDNDLSYAVIEWDIGGAPPATPRRIMVIS